MRDQFQFALGIAAMLQACFLPGYVAAYLFRVRGMIPTLIMAFAMSMIINHAMVVLLTLAGLQSCFIWYSLFVVELVWIWRLSGRSDVTPTPDEGCAPKSAATASEFLEHIHQAAKYAAIASVLVFILYAVMDAGSIFTTWDAVGSWNPWGVSWSMGTVPRIWGTYPQLIPSAYAVTYLFLGNTKIQFFAKALVPLFPIMILLTMLDLGRAKRSTGILLGVTICGLLLYFANATANENLLLSGYADVPVSFFCILVFWCLFRAQDRNDTTARHQYLLLGAIAAIGASVTKQTGMYVAALYPLLAHLLVLRPAEVALRDSWRPLLRLSLLMGVCIAPWYVYREILILQGLSEDNFEELVVGLHGRRTILERITYGFDLLSMQLGGYYVLIVIGALSLLSMPVRSYRWMLILVVVPFTMIWAAAFSYSMRNVALVVPLFALSAGVGLEQLISAVYSVIFWMKAHQQGRSWLAGTIGVGIAAVIVMSFIFSHQYLLDQQLAMQRVIGDRRLNKFLYEYHQNRPIKGKIASHYTILPFLPGFEKFVVGLRMYDYAKYESQCADPEIRYFLMPTWANPFYDQKIVSDARRRIEQGQFACLLDADSWLYVRKTSPHEQVNNRRLADAEKFVENREFDKAIEVLEPADMEALDAPGRGYYLYAFSLQYSPNRSDEQSREKALKLYDKALGAKFDEFWIRFSRGCLYSSLDRRTEALKDFERASELNPGHEEVRRRLEELKQSHKT